MKMKKILAISMILGVASQLSASAQDDATIQRIADLETKVSKLEESSGGSFRGYWRNGFHFEQPDQEFKLQIGGRVQMDTAFFSADDELEEAVGEFDDGIKFRRARLFLRGNLYDNLEFFTEYDFAGGAQFRTLYVGVKNVPFLGTIRAGHLLEPIGFEELCSNNHITLMERGGPSAFNPIRNSGIMAFNTALDQRMTWAAGIFKETGNFGDSVSNEEFAVSARITGLPYYENKGRQYLHLGVSSSYREISDDGYRVRARPESFVAPYVLDTKSIAADSVNLLGLESLLTLGSFSLQGEWSQSAVDDITGSDGSSLDDADLTAYYVMASYLLTGEHRPYSKSSGIITRITPNENATGKNWGKGAWEVAARYNKVDLNDGGIEGGEMESYTFGLNWYLNPHSRVMWNYVMADVKNTGDVDVFQMRVQVDF